MGTKKKFIKHNLPVDNYEIIDTFSLSEGDYIVCDNCGKVIRNIAVVQDSKGRRYNVGLDCAETLSGIDEYDITFWSDNFNRAKSIRAKIRNAKKKYGITPIVKNIIGEKQPFIKISGNGYYWGEGVTEEFLKKYLPELAKIARVNYEYKPIDTGDFFIESGEMYGGFKFIYELKTNERFGHKYAYAEIWKDGQMLASGSNGGNNVDACITECARLYNRAMFESGLHPII